MGRSDTSIPGAAACYASWSRAKTPSRDSMRRSGVRSALIALVAVAAAACWLPYGFAGGGLPANIRTVAVLPFDNETSTPDLQRDVTETLRRELARKLGLREAAENRASAVVRGTILRYELDIPIGFSADPSRATTARRKDRKSVV